MANFLSNIFQGNSLKRLEGVILNINKLEPELKSLSNDDLKIRVNALKEKIKTEDLRDDFIPEAFALVREASVRTLGQRHYDVQLIGGIVLHEGKIAEMLTGEGKTLSATLPAFFNALKGEGVHVVTVNDYLAKRDTIWMGQIYYLLGLRVSCLVHDGAFIYDPEYTKEAQGENIEKDLDKTRDILGSFKIFEEFLRPVGRKEAYEADITYGTNHEFGFDFLRDNLVIKSGDKVQKKHFYAIIDEIDSILIDEARTPLIIAAPDRQSSQFYKTFAKVVEHLEAETDYAVDEKARVANITEAGIEKVEKLIGITNLFSPDNSRLVHYLQESLKAKSLFRKDKEYVVKNGEILIIDEFTGRMLLGRRYSGGLHQAIEAKEGVLVKEENRTYAQITIQNYFRLYKKISGMTGTAQTSAEEFHKVYNLDVQSIPPNKLMVRKDLSDLIYKTKEAKYKAVVEEIKKRHEKGQPVLVGTASITNNEIISEFLSKANIPHEVLNAKNNEREGAIIAQAGKLGSVTVATNMAGRGVDIILGGNPSSLEEAEKVLEAGGLHIVGTERHEARRIDNQLRGRAGRQGDPGSSLFFLSLEDDLIRIFGGDRIKNLMERFKVPEDTPIEAGLISKAVNQAQSKVEGANFDIRRHLLDFDDILNKQRTAIYNKRVKYLESAEKNEILPILEETLNNFVNFATQKIEAEEQTIEEKEKKIKELKEKLDLLPKEIESARSIVIGQHFIRILDSLWIDHLEDLEALRDSVNIRAYGQHEPLVEYRREAFQLFQQLNSSFEFLLFNTIFPLLQIDLNAIQNQNRQRVETPKDIKKLGRNDPCWCGSGKKYKKCHGK